jgi:hypothetical protein
MVKEMEGVEVGVIVVRVLVKICPTVARVEKKRNSIVMTKKKVNGKVMFMMSLAVLLVARMIHLNSPGE